ncbi:hypothetical protein D1872_335440 [compost metagenome]
MLDCQLQCQKYRFSGWALRERGSGYEQGFGLANVVLGDIRRSQQQISNIVTIHQYAAFLRTLDFGEG